MAKKYTVIIKAGADRFVKYRNVGNLLRLVAYLDRAFPEWKYFNVYDRRTRDQLGSYTKKSRPTSAKI